MRPIRFGLVLGFAATSLFALQEATTVQQQQRVQGGERQEEKKLPELSSEQRRRASKLLQDAAANSADRPGSLIHLSTENTTPPLRTRMTALPNNTRPQSDAMTERSISRPTWS